jgi:glucosamine--fructose-6-phosphate aminotransferase (isomerizing)
MFILGKGRDEAIAKEGSLKLKEIAYIHAEGYSSSALKHGPFALIENGLPIIILDINDEYRDKNRNAYQEVSARNAFVLKITDINESDNSLIIEKNATFGGLLANIYIQLLSYYLALSQNYNPDFPRNLAKVVTVE